MATELYIPPNRKFNADKLIEVIEKAHGKVEITINSNGFLNIGKELTLTEQQDMKNAFSLISTEVADITQ